MLQTILSALVAGIIIGPLARLVLPGRQNIGSAIFQVISGRSNTPGIDWIALGIGVVVAAVAIMVYAMMTSRESTASSTHPLA